MKPRNALQNKILILIFKLYNDIGFTITKTTNINSHEKAQHAGPNSTIYLIFRCSREPNTFLEVRMGVVDVDKPKPYQIH